MFLLFIYVLTSMCSHGCFTGTQASSNNLFSLWVQVRMGCDALAADSNMDSNSNCGP